MGLIYRGVNHDQTGDYIKELPGLYAFLDDNLDLIRSRLGEVFYSALRKIKARLEDEVNPSDLENVRNRIYDAIQREKK
ncbi:MAG: hypothetical protein AABX47_07040 [Nanoarchaeota archaeon]